jgi:Ser/Thr protein kinase RdoA (MazF antagonist)
LIAEPEPDLVLLEWIAGTSLAEAGAVEPADTVAVGHAITRLHAAGIPPEAADVRAPFPRLADGWSHLHTGLQPLATDLTSMLLEATPEPCVLLHGDLVPYNVILTVEGPRFVDPIPARGFSSWDLAKLAVSWRALGQPGILASLLAGYGSVPPLLAELATWITLVYLEKNLPYPSSPLRPHLLPLAEELSATPVPEVFVARCL